jgi:predicted GH43/DUF377 family glycosyl hydrolase
MRVRILNNTRLKIGTILLAIIVVTVTLLFVSLGTVFSFSPEYVNWPAYPGNPVFNPTERAYYPSIIFSGSTYYMWYDNGSGTSYTTSPDGINWNVGIPVIGLTNARHALVKWVGTEYRVWYWDSAMMNYSINDFRTAVSPDGITWNSDSVISQVNTTVITGNAGYDWNAGSYGPCDVFYNPAGSGTIITPVVAATVWQNKFVMYYNGTTGGLEDIGIAVSADGINWRGYNDGLAPVIAHSGSGWDSDYVSACTVLKIDGVYHMWYSGGNVTSHEGIGYAQSTDGITWTKYASNPIMHITDSVPWRTERTYTPRVLYDAASFSGAGEAVQLKMWWNGTADDDYAIGYSGYAMAVPPTSPTPTPVGVGGRVNEVNKTVILMPYIYSLLAIIAVVTGGLVRRKLASEKANSRKH